MRVELRCTTMVNGVQCVMMDGMILMLLWYVDNWDFIHQYEPLDQLVLVKEQDQSGWIMLSVLVMNQH